MQQSFSIESLSIDVGYSIETFLKEIKPVITEKHELEYEDDPFFYNFWSLRTIEI